MYKYIGFIIISILFSCKSNDYVQGKQNDVKPCFAPDIAFKGGEKLTYKLFYQLGAITVTAGEVTFSVSDEGEQYRVLAIGKTYSSYEKIFKVDDHYEAVLDKKTLLPLVSIRKVHEGNYHLYDKVVFNQKTYEAISYRGKTEADATQSSIDMSNCMHDLISIIYFSRNVDFKNLEKDSYFPISIFMDRKEHPLRIQYKGEQKNLKIRGKKKENTLVFAAQTVDGRVFPTGAEVQIWVSDDATHTPLMIASPLSVGSVKAVLVP
jgi:dsDNA-binding SOS-regulon protein